MSHTPPVRAKGPADLLALVPGLIGFHPEDSVVVLTVGEATQPFHARVDLPGDPVAVEGLARHLTRVATRNGVTRMACVLYTDDAGLAEAFGEELDRRLGESSVDLVCMVRADGERWWPLGVHPDGRAATRGTRYDVSAHPLMAQTVLDGTPVLGSRRELADTLVGTDVDQIGRVGALGDEVMRRLGGALEAPLGPRSRRHHLGLEGRWVRQCVRRWLQEGRRLDEQEVARLAVLISVSVDVRDVAWAEMDHGNADRHVDLWRDVVRRVPVHLRAAPAALLGFSAWLSGDGALAWCAVECAHDAEPGYSLATLLSDALVGAVPPSVWRPFPREQLTLFAQA